MPVPEPIKIAKNILSNFFTINVHSILIDQKNGNYTLNSQHSTVETSDTRGRYVLWPLPVREELSDIYSRHPIYFSFIIKINDINKIQELSIKLFKEDTTIIPDSATIPTELLLRVDWLNQSENENIKHAQPHWHIHSYKIIDMLEGRSAADRELFYSLLETDNSQDKNDLLLNDMQDKSLLKKDQKKSDPSKYSEIPIYMFHLAMIAEWDKPNPATQTKILTSTVLEKWLPKCLEYIKLQVEYILEKMKP